MSPHVMKERYTQNAECNKLTPNIRGYQKVL